MKNYPEMKSVKFIGSFSGTPIKENEFIFVITSIESDGNDGKTGWGWSENRSWGWLATEKEAKHAVAINAGDMHETTYDYVVIEKSPSGIPTVAEVVAWYKWTGKNGPVWKRCKAPKWSEGICNWGF